MQIGHMNDFYFFKFIIIVIKKNGLENSFVVFEYSLFF